MAKLKLMIKPSFAPGGRSLMLCDQTGEPLPNQLACNVSCDSESSGRVVVEFLIDGAEVSFDAGEQAEG